MIPSHPVLRWLAAAAIGCGIVIWAGLALFALTMVTQGEGSYTPGRKLLILVMGLFLALGCGAMVAAWRVLRRPPTRRRLPLAVLVIVGAQLAVLLRAYNLSHYVRSGEAWVDSTWRQQLSDAGLIELFAYYPWLGAAAIAAAVVVIALMLACLLHRSDVAKPAAAPSARTPRSGGTAR